MVYQLFKIDPAWKVARYMIPFFGIGGLVATNTMGAAGATLVLGGMIAGLLSTSSMLTRSSVYLAALPISGRQLFLARTSACLALASGPFLAAAAACFAANPLHPQTSLQFLAMGAVFGLAVLASLAFHVEEFSGSARVSAVLLWSAVFASTLTIWPRAAVAIAAVSIAGCLVRWLTVWPRVPESFQAAPFAPMEVSRPQWRGWRMPVAPVWWAVLRASIPWQAAVMFPVVMIQGLFNNIALGILFLFGTPGLIRERVRWLAPFPISQRVILALIFGPYLTTLAIGYGLEVRYGVNRESWLSFDLKSGLPTMQVPLEFWLRAPGGKAPVIEAPWGESFQPPVTRILGVAIYNPYGSGRDSSRRFQEWQYSHAAEAIYGRPVTFAEAQSGRHDPLIPLSMRGRGAVLGGALLLAVGLLVQWLIGLNYWHRLPAPAGRKVAGWIVPPAVVAILGTDFWFLTNSPGSLLGAAGLSLLLHLLRWLPDQPVITGAFALLLLVVPWSLISRQFRRSEIYRQQRAASVLG